MSEIITYTKIHMDPFAPKPEDFCIADIAHALSLMTRANGHFPIFYSVGQHCIACCKEAAARGYPPRLSLACLLHDAGEAYLSDLTRPVKQHLDAYCAAEERLLDLLYARFLGAALSPQEKQAVAKIDDTMLYYEFLEMTGERLSDCAETLAEVPRFVTEPFTDTEKEYNRLYGLLSAQAAKIQD